MLSPCAYKLAFHNADTDTDILARIVARMSACRSACYINNFRESRVSDVSARILARMSVSVSAPWNASYMEPERIAAAASLAELEVHRLNETTR